MAMSFGLSFVATSRLTTHRRRTTTGIFNGPPSLRYAVAPSVGWIKAGKSQEELVDAPPGLTARSKFGIDQATRAAPPDSAPSAENIQRYAAINAGAIR